MYGVKVDFIHDPILPEYSGCPDRYLSTLLRHRLSICRDIGDTTGYIHLVKVRVSGRSITRYAGTCAT